jgi:exo-beta-1,3-glucanase (GH17 family)
LILETIRADNLPIRVFLGIWLSGSGEKGENREQVRRGVELANRFDDIVVAVCVGNETQVSWSGHRLAPERLTHYIREVRASTRVPITTADDFSFWLDPRSQSIAREVDFITTHMYALWNGVSLADAMRWTDERYRAVVKAHPSKSVVIGETGWATDYDATQVGPGAQGTLIRARVDQDAQRTYLKEHFAWVRHTHVLTFLFEAFDEPWKGGGQKSSPRDVEKHWGVYGSDRVPKVGLLDSAPLP